MVRIPGLGRNDLLRGEQSLRETLPLQVPVDCERDRVESQLFARAVGFLVFIDMIPVLLLDFLTLVPLLLFFERVVTLGNAWNQTFLLTVIDGSFFIGLFYHFFRLDNFQFVLDNAVFGDNLVLGRYFLSFEKHLLELLLTS